ncbi:MAG TPA: CRISPR-associated protein Cas4 [Candidatus Egerieicola pullicola]|mgnify:FL=1|uniref:CRISPR-associated exonuclease Cas4 n=1 Tax=Candidatus Egerieicola pullicola TaxID=2840775 RepID=A0A9D1AIB2_9FIRM|nr:CRISPR-associated protein Cas4 [Candidatus Egerieicola pullicola]
MSYREEDYLQLSGIQHFAFCPRQWALIHLENLWQENLQTAQGQLLHQRCHDAGQDESRGDLLILRDLRISSPSLGLSGACDVVEFHRDPKGVSLQGRDGLWMPYPVEYKRGKPKPHQADELQLCAQAICLEEMLCCSIPEGALFYGEPRRRQTVTLDESLRQTVKEMAEQMHQYAQRGYTPKVKPKKGCSACSLKDLCLPVLCKNRSAAQWTAQRLEEEV